MGLIEVAEKNYKKANNTTTPYIFVYGTLMSKSRSQIDDIFDRHTTLVTDATVNGKLYLVERPDGSLKYPGLVLSKNDDDIVYGEVFRISGTKEILKKLDEYEECAPESPKPHEYRREVIDIKGPSGEALRAFAYIYNRNIDNLELIESGSFVKYKMKDS